MGKKGTSLILWAQENNPSLIGEWDKQKNTMPIEDANIGSDKKAWWVCEKGHSWEATISSRKGGNNCPYCSNQKILPGYNDLATINPQLASEWDYERNAPLTPQHVAAGSNKKVWWVCDKGHSWLASVGSRKAGGKCPYCLNQRILPGYNDLATLNPKLASEWNHEKNGDLLPSMIAAKSNKRVWWKCRNGHEWQNSPSQRKNNGCPYCSNQLLLVGWNDLATTNPEALFEWDYDKNIDIDPSTVQPGSEIKVWWKCARGHSYKMQIDLKVKYGHSCPLCSKGRHVSFPEKAVAYYFQKIDNSVIEGYNDSNLQITELDIYSPRKRVGVEYDGQRWHKKQTTKRDIAKNEKCKAAGITLYRIREAGCDPLLNNSSIDFYYDPKNKGALEEIIRELVKRIYGVDSDVDLERDRINIYKKIEIWFENNSALVLDPDALNEWDYEKNKGLKPENFSANTHKKVWWTCSHCGGSWQASIANRNRNNGCPYCTGHKLLSGFNDLATTAPELLDEWDYDKNIITPSGITAHSAEKVWWKCKFGHSYQARVSNRVDLGRGCPVCANKQIVSGVNDLATVNPELVSEWDYSKNRISPTKIASGYNKKVWWKCTECGFEWQISPNARTSKKSGCPRCADRRKGASGKRRVQQTTMDGVIIQVFDSVKEAAIAVKRNPAAIVNACKGKTNTCAGYKWRYLDCNCKGEKNL